MKFQIITLSEQDLREMFELFDPVIFEDVLERLGPWGIEEISYDLKALELKADAGGSLGGHGHDVVLSVGVDRCPPTGGRAAAVSSTQPRPC